MSKAIITQILEIQALKNKLHEAIAEEIAAKRTNLIEIASWCNPNNSQEQRARDFNLAAKPDLAEIRKTRIIDLLIFDNSVEERLYQSNGGPHPDIYKVAISVYFLRAVTKFIDLKNQTPEGFNWDDIRDQIRERCQDHIIPTDKRTFNRIYHRFLRLGNDTFKLTPKPE